MSDHALGLWIGDVIRTSYGTGPYTIKSISGPNWWWMGYSYITIWPYPVVSLILSNHSYGNSYLSNIHQDAKRWFTDQGDEIILVKSRAETIQLALFDVTEIDNDPRKKPYEFDETVNYTDQNHVFKCWKLDCLRDFNGDKWNGGHANPHCPYCGAWCAISMVIMDKVIPGKFYWSEYQKVMGFTGNPEDWRGHSSKSSNGYALKET